MTRGEPKATASAFANWVYKLYNRPRFKEIDQATREERMKLGVIAHRDIEIFLHHKWTLNFLGPDQITGWRLWFADSTDYPSRIFMASRLTINGNPLKCVPDLVLKHEPTGEFLVIERKTTYLPEFRIPVDGWPNIEAQLWCYSWIDEFANSPRVRLIGQLWTNSNRCLSLCQHHPSWLRSDASHEQRCANHFLEYGGRIDLSS